jgi:hypothetical protein
LPHALLVKILDTGLRLRLSHFTALRAEGAWNDSVPLDPNSIVEMIRRSDPERVDQREMFEKLINYWSFKWFSHEEFRSVVQLLAERGLNFSERGKGTNVSFAFRACEALLSSDFSTNQLSILF